MPSEVEIILKAVDKASATLKKTQGSFAGLKDAAKGLAVTMGGVAAAGAAARQVYQSIIKPTMDYGLAVSDLATKAGTSAEEASKMLQIADDLRIENAALETGFRFLTRQGIQPTIENIGALSDEYRNLKDPVARAQFAMQMFGSRAGPELQRLLEQGASGLDGMAKSAEAAGLVIDDLQAQKMVDLYGRIDEMQDHMQGWKLAAGFALSDEIMLNAEAIGIVNERLIDAGKTETFLNWLRQTQDLFDALEVGRWQERLSEIRGAFDGATGPAAPQYLSGARGRENRAEAALNAEWNPKTDMTPGGTGGAGAPRFMTASELAASLASQTLQTDQTATITKLKDVETKIEDSGRKTVVSIDGLKRDMPRIMRDAMIAALRMAQ